GAKIWGWLLLVVLWFVYFRRVAFEPVLTTALYRFRRAGGSAGASRPRGYDGVRHVLRCPWLLRPRSHWTTAPDCESTFTITHSARCTRGSLPYRPNYRSSVLQVVFMFSFGVFTQRTAVLLKKGCCF
ncbi:unnamed protein product, partial [Ectocarpus sp. 4 AP-2014]